MVTCTPSAVCIDWWYVCYCNEQCYNDESSTQIWYRHECLCCVDGDCWIDYCWLYYNWCYADLCSPCGAASYGGDCTV